MESLAFMILTLPHALGGYGLGGAVFNHEIKLRDEAGKRLGQKRCFADLYYKPAKLAVEYESFAFHNSPSEQGKDMMRSAILERQGVEVMHLSTIQLYDKDACKDFVFNLASRLGRRIQIRTKKFDEMHALLRALLPAGKPVVEPDGGQQ
jgi:very-short-patch-repair endonuclease